MSRAIITIGNLYSSIKADPPLEESIVARLSLALSYKMKDSRFIIRAIYGDKVKESPHPEWDGTVKMFWHERGNLFFTGMMSSVTEILTSFGVDYDFEFIRKRPEVNMPDLKLIRTEGMEDREYQEVSIEMLYEATRGIMQAATGSGKTFMTADLISRIKTSPFIFYVLSVDLLEQAHGELSKFLNVPIGRVGGGIVDIKEINVVMIQSAIRALHRNDQKFDMGSYKYDDEDLWLEDSKDEVDKAGQIVDMIRNAKGVVADEVHHYAARTCREVLEASKLAYWRYGCSATPCRDDGQEPMIKALFGKKIVEISASLLIQLGYLVRPHIFIVRMNDFHGDYASYSSIYKHYVADNKVLNDLVIKLSQFFDEKKVSNLTLVKQYSQGEYIKKGHGDIPFIRGDQTKKKRVDALAKLRSGEISGCIATTLADEGLDVRRLSAVIVAGGGKSQTRVYQRIGRALRTFTDEITGKVKDTAIVVLFHHNCRFLDGHGKTIRKLLKKEKEFVLIDTTPEKLFQDISSLLSPQDNLVDLFQDKK
jgi:superfamily II DNA or RNA helicase